MGKLKDYLSKVKDNRRSYYEVDPPEGLDEGDIFNKFLAKNKPDFTDVYGIYDGYASMDLSHIINKLSEEYDGDFVTNIARLIDDAVTRETGLPTDWEGYTLGVNLGESSITQYEEYDYETGKPFVSGDTYFEVYDLLPNEAGIIDKKLANQFILTEDTDYKSNILDVNYDDNIRYWGKAYIDVNFVEDGEDFAKSKIADKMWHAVYHVLEDNDLLHILTADESIEATERIESNYFAFEDGLYSGSVIIKKIMLYWESEYSVPAPEIDEEYYLEEDK